MRVNFRQKSSSVTPDCPNCFTDEHNIGPYKDPIFKAAQAVLPMPSKPFDGAKE
jgi:hypothetical protein